MEWKKIGTQAQTHMFICVLLLFKFSDIYSFSRLKAHTINVTHVADIWHHKQNENIKFSHLAMMSFRLHRQQSQRIHTSTNGNGIPRGGERNTSESKFCTLFKEYKCSHIQRKQKRHCLHTYKVKRQQSIIGSIREREREQLAAAFY